MASLQDLYAQLGLNPLMDAPTMPTMPRPYLPYDPTVTPGTAYGMPYFGAIPAPAEEAPVEETPDIYGPPVAEEDPLAALLGPPAIQQQQPPRHLRAQPTPLASYGGGAGQQQLERQAAMDAGPTPGERALLQRSPAYARAITRIRDLDRMRAAKGI